MVTGHFIKVTNSASKKGKQLALDPLAIEKMQGLADPAGTSDTEGEKLSPKNPSPRSAEKDKQGEGSSDKMEETETKTTSRRARITSRATDCMNEGGEAVKGKMSPDLSDRGKTPSPSASSGRGAAPEPLADAAAVLAINPLSALQSVLNNHLGKANKPNSADKLSAHAKSVFADISRGGDKAALMLGKAAANRPDNAFLFVSDDQPIDLTKSKHSKRTAPLLQPSAPMPQKYALSDIADMVKVLPKATTPKPSLPSRIPSMKLESDVRRFEDVSSEVYSVHKRKGRQSNWNPRHLLILQAQFASSLFQTSEGKYLLSDLGPQERMHISKFTGLSMTTIRGTKFLKNMDTGHPVFYCNDCASQFRSPAAFIAHLESHLGFQIKDMCKMPVEHQTKVEEPELDIDAKFKCKLCCRTFASNHAVKLHLSKTHSKSPDNHSQYVEMDKE
uniref:Teashirt zinc finger homeobox 2 n=1 Tax=Takifugu rubripes TaxID=31033 RepID=A0A674N788_TAKRU